MMMMMMMMTDDDYYAARSCPSSYDQSSGNGQSLSRRYCTQSVWLFSCAIVRPESPKALWRFRVSTSNSLKWPFSAAYAHAYSSNLSYLRSTRYSSM